MLYVNNSRCFEANNINTILEGRTKTVSSEAKTFKELYGMDYKASKYYEEPKLPNPYLLAQIGADTEWNGVCNASCYCHIRIAGRAAQIRAEEHTFLLDDVFRIFTYWVAGSKVSIGTGCKIDYNQDANLWVIYICPELPTDKNRYIWIQPPHTNHAIKCVYEGISDKRGIRLKPYERNSLGFKAIAKYYDDLEYLSTRYYERFVDAFKQASINFKEVEGLREAKPSASLYEWPYCLLYYKKE